MESRAHAIVAGLFTVLLGAGVVLAALWFSRENYDRVFYVLESRHSVTGLNPQATVRLRGVPIGKVVSIEFDPADARLILITIAVKGGSAITRGTSAQLNLQGVTGTSYVNLEDDGKNTQFLPPSTDKEQRIRVKRSLFDEVADSGQDILLEAHMVAKQVQNLLSDANQKQLFGAIKSVQAMSDHVAALSQSLGAGTKNLPALTSDARKMIAGADNALREVGPALQEAKKTLAGIDNLAREYTQRAEALDRVAKSAEQLSGASQGIAGTANTFAGDIAPRLNALMDELARNSRNLDRLLNDLNDQPQGLVFGRAGNRPGPGEAGFRDGK